MVNKPLCMKYAFTRARFLERLKNLNENSIMLDLSKCKNPNVYKKNIENFLKECTSYRDAIFVLETLYNDNQKDLLQESVNIITNMIIPMIPNSELKSCKSLVELSNIGKDTKDKLNKTIDIYHQIDRIKKNHSIVSGRFNLSDFNTYSDKDKCYRLCEMVCTYDISNDKLFTFALEELSYLGYTTGKPIQEDVLVENVLDYFLLKGDTSEKDIEGYKRAIKNSNILSMNADKRIKYFTENYKRYGIDQKINDWKMNPNKTLQQISALAKNNYHSEKNLNKIISVINEYCNINNIGYNSSDLLKDADISLNITESRNLVKFMESNQLNDSEMFKYAELIYENNLNNESYYGYPTTGIFTLNEINHFKTNDLFVDAKMVHSILDQSEKMVNNKIKLECVASYNPSIIKEGCVADYVDNCEYISIPIRSYCYECSDIDTIATFADHRIKSINSKLFNRNSVAYYSLSESDNQLDIFLRSKYKVALSLSEESRKGISAYDKFNVVRINEGLNYLQSLLEDDNTPTTPPVVPDANKQPNPPSPPPTIQKEKKSLKEKISDAGDKVAKTWSDIKLSWEGIKSKAKQASAKEQEMSRDLDMEFNNVIRNAKNFLDSPGDKRAELITGQVNHSISKTLKIGLGLAAIGAAAGSYVLPILGAIGLYAKSKNLSDKEKVKLLDEIDVELKVLDGEISKAENSDSPDRYRQLLLLKKQFQRKRQEINSSIGYKTKIFMSKNTKEDEN